MVFELKPPIEPQRLWALRVVMMQLAIAAVAYLELILEARPFVTPSDMTWHSPSINPIFFEQEHESLRKPTDPARKKGVPGP